MNSFVMADPNKCIGCRTCEIACVMAHSNNNVFLSNEGDFQIAFNPGLSVVRTPEITAPIQCRNCEDAPCAKVCPNESITNKDGAILINRKTCIGCKTCVIACPFGAIDIVEEYDNGNKIRQSRSAVVEDGIIDHKVKLVANKCDLCSGREKGPACLESCPTDALKLVNAEDIKISTQEKRLLNLKDISTLFSK